MRSHAPREDKNVSCLDNVRYLLFIFRLEFITIVQANAVFVICFIKVSCIFQKEPTTVLNKNRSATKLVDKNCTFSEIHR